MIFGKKADDAAGAASWNNVAGGKTMEERRNAAPRSQIDDGRIGGASPRGSRVQDDKTSTLSPHLAFEGNLKFTGKVIVDCEFRGTIVTDDTLIVGSSGKLEAEVTAGIVEISGKVRGNIKAKTRVKILSGGEVHGNLETPTVSMEEGVVFEGNCTRPADGRQTDASGQQAQIARAGAALRKAIPAAAPPEPQPQTTT
jgi:cytoskeletal protein CcmA (bactofilin family)